MRSFLPHSIAATLGVLAFPSAVLFSLLFLTEPNPPVLLCSAISLALSSGASVIGARLWQRHPSSNEISFGDLMIWSWVTRRRAEARLQRGTAALGLDRRGAPVGDQKLTRADQLRVLHELNNALESKDPYTRGHSGRVERHVFRMANTMGLSVHEIEDLRLAASLHDVGKIRVPDHILRKPGKLTTDEYRIMQDHPSVGAWMLSYVGNQDVIEAVRYHHERWDGRGYPDGVSGTDIPLFARMIAVADTFDAITSTRPYRAKAAREEGLRELDKAAGSQLDPMCVEAFASSLPEPIPVAALLYLLPFGIKKLVREFGVVARRTGLQTIASGVGAASAAVIVTAPVVAPALGAPARVERTIETSTQTGIPGVAADDGESEFGQVADDGEVEGDASTSLTKNEDESDASTPELTREGDEPLTSLPIVDDGTIPPESGTTDTGTSGGSGDTATTTTVTDNSGEGSADSGSGHQNDNRGPGNNNGNDKGNGNGNPGASAGADGAPGNSGRDKDKPKDDKGNPGNGKDDEPAGDDGSGGGGSDGGEDPGADPGNGNSGGSGEHGGGNGNAEGNNGNGGDHGNAGGNGNGGGSDAGNAGGNGNSEDKGNDKEKDPAGTD